MSDPYDLDRFVLAQDQPGVVGDLSGFERALEEIRRGRKITHWIWWVFPQLAGLGRSSTSVYYGLSSLDEARAYLAHPVLAPRLLQAVAAMIEHVGASAYSILGTDDVKFHSSLTLFLLADAGEQLLRDALDQFFQGRLDPQTSELLGDPG